MTAHTPREALTLVEEHRRDIQLLLTDVVLPEMNGKDLSARLRETCHGLTTLFMSGDTANVIAHRGVLDERVHFM